MSRGERAPQPGQEEQGDQLQAALQTLESGIDSILSSEGFAAYLSTMARFYSYSPSNIALILTQAPEATRVAGYKKWQELGRQVRKGEKGIIILVPHKRRQSRDHQDADEHKEEGITTERTVVTSVSGFGVGRVFDRLSRDSGIPYLR